MTPLDELLARPAFAVDDRVVTWVCVIAAARASGAWDATEAAAAAGLAAPESADVGAAVTAHVAQWRRARRLVSADDTVAFLSRWGVAEAEWLGHMRRQVAGRSATSHTSSCDPGELARAAWIEGVTTGALERAALRLAESMALPDADVASPASIAALIESRWLEWSRLVLREVVLGDEGAAREFTYCVRDDARELDEVAAAAGVVAVVRDVALGDLPASLSGALMSARAGDVIGPLADEGGFRVAVVDARDEPSADDPRTVERARAELVARSVRAAVARQVRWLDPALVSA